MFYLDEDSEDEEEKVPEGVYHGKAPAGILVSDTLQHAAHPLPPPNTNLESKTWSKIFLRKELFRYT